MYTIEFKIFLHRDIEGKSSREVSESHQIADRLHDIPGQILEGTVEDHGELSDRYGATSPQQGLGLPCLLLLDCVDFELSETDLKLKLIQTVFERWKFGMRHVVFGFRIQIGQNCCHTV